MFLEKSEGPAFSSGDFERMETTCKSYEKYLNCIVLVLEFARVFSYSFAYLKCAKKKEHTLQTIFSQAGSRGRKDGRMDRQAHRWTHGWMDAKPRDGSLW